MAEGRSGAARIGAALAIALLALAWRAPVADLPLERDEGEYAYIAQRWLEGELPYRDSFDQKPPAIFAFYALVFAVAGESIPALRWAAALLALPGLLALAALGHRFASAPAGLAAAAIGSLLLVTPHWFGQSVNTELLAFTPLSCAAWSAWRARDRRSGLWACCAGTLGALALLCKPVAAPMVGLALLVPLAGGAGALRRTGAGMLGALLPPLAVAALFAAAGAFAPFFDATVLHNLAYATSVPLREYPRHAAERLLPTLATLGPIYAAAGIGGWASLAGAVPAAGAGLVRLFPAAWLLAAVPAVAAGGYFREHYFTLAAAPLALLAGIGLDALAGLAPPRLRRPLLAAAVVALLAHAGARDAWYFTPGPTTARMARLYGPNPFPEAPGLGRWLAERSSRDERIFVYGSEPELLFHARRRSASRYIYLYPLHEPHPTSADRQKEVLRELDAAAPRFVVGVFVSTSQRMLPGAPALLRDGLRERLARDYRVVAAVPYDHARSGKVLEGEQARARWRARPLWYAPAVPWAAYVVWERRLAAETEP